MLCFLIPQYHSFKPLFIIVHHTPESGLQTATDIVLFFFSNVDTLFILYRTWGSADVLNISIGVIRPQIITGKEMGCCKATQTFPVHELPTPCLHICATFYHLHLSECFHLLCNHWNKEYLTGCFGGMGCVSDELTAQSDSSVVYGSPQMFSNNF